MSPSKVFSKNIKRKTIAEFRLLVSPELAVLMLQRNTRNRETREAGIKDNYREVMSDKWAPIADGIAFDSNGVLLDGQHRLLAIAAANKSVEINCAFGLNPECRALLDVRSRLTDSSGLEALGFTHGDLRSSVARLYLIHVKKAEVRRFSIDQIAAAATELKPQLDVIAPLYGPLSRNGVQSHLFFALTMGLLTDKPGQPSTKDFMAKFISFERSGETDPVLKFEQLTRREKGRTRESIMHAGLHCLRAFRSGGRIERVRGSDELVRLGLVSEESPVSAEI